MKEIKISVNYWKLGLLLLASIAFVVAGYYMFNAEPTRKRPEWFLKFWGVASMLFFGVCGVFILLSFFKKTAIIISEEGIWDNSSMFSVGLIKWADIQKISKTKIADITHIMLHLDPKKEDFYISQVKSPIKRKLLAFNMKGFGYAITATMLKIKAEELYQAMQTEFKNYKKR